jgi:hypothetical protein
MFIQRACSLSRQVQNVNKCVKGGSRRDWVPTCHCYLIPLDIYRKYYHHWHPFTFGMHFAINQSPGIFKQQKAYAIAIHPNRPLSKARWQGCYWAPTCRVLEPYLDVSYTEGTFLGICEFKSVHSRESNYIPTFRDHAADKGAQVQLFKLFCSLNTSTLVSLS